MKIRLLNKIWFNVLAIIAGGYLIHVSNEFWMLIANVIVISGNTLALLINLDL